jgi:hypothetical protein
VQGVGAAAPRWRRTKQRRGAARLAARGGTAAVDGESQPEGEAAMGLARPKSGAAPGGWIKEGVHVPGRDGG